MFDHKKWSDFYSISKNGEKEYKFKSFYIFILLKLFYSCVIRLIMNKYKFSLFFFNVKYSDFQVLIDF